jgi:hypothetical protein
LCPGADAIAVILVPQCSGDGPATAIEDGLDASCSAFVLAGDDRGSARLKMAITEERAYPLRMEVRRSKSRVNPRILRKIQKISLAFGGGVD